MKANKKTGGKNKYCGYALIEKTNIDEFVIKNILHGILSKEYQNKFYSELVELCRCYKAVSCIEEQRIDNESISIILKTVSKHIPYLAKALDDIDYFRLILAENSENETETEILMRFPTPKELMIIKRLCDKTLREKNYAQKPTKAEMQENIACATAVLLNKYKIKYVLTENKPWDQLIENVLKTLGIESSYNQRKNYMKTARCKITEKQKK